MPADLTDCFMSVEFTSLEQLFSLDDAVLPAIVCVGFLLLALLGSLYPCNMQRRLLDFRPKPYLCIGSSVLLFWSILSLTGVSTFLYFTF